MLSQAFSEIELRQEVHRLIDLLPLEKIADVRQFIATQQISQTAVAQSTGKGNGLHPSKMKQNGVISPQPASSLNLFTTALAQGYEGDALLDTEALYDDV